MSDLRTAVSDPDLERELDEFRRRMLAEGRVSPQHIEAEVQARRRESALRRTERTAASR